MITEEKLRELLKQGATIYGKYRDYVLKNSEYKSSDFWYRRTVEIRDNKLHYTYEDSDYYEDCDVWIELEDLFETQEQAEWHKEFGNITRTEKLKLPTWEEAQKKLEVEICAPKGKKYLLQTKIITGYSCERENPYIIRIDRIGYANSQIDFEYTKENYIEACRLAKKLFLGGDDERVS